MLEIFFIVNLGFLELSLIILQKSFQFASAKSMKVYQLKIIANFDLWFFTTDINDF